MQTMCKTQQAATIECAKECTNPLIDDPNITTSDAILLGIRATTDARTNTEDVTTEVQKTQQP